MPRQSTLQYLHRLADGHCPIHGTPMTQIGVAEDRNTLIVECDQTGCNIQGTKSQNDTAVVLLPEFSHLLDPDKPNA
jgi:hypothetical protein